MERTLATQLRLAVRNWWIALAIVADDDGLESDLMPAALARPFPTATRTPVQILVRNDA